MNNESEFTDEYVLKLQEEIEYEQYCNEQLRNKITNLEYKIKRLEEDNKYRIVLDKIKEYIKEDKNCVPKHISDYILELLEEVE